MIDHSELLVVEAYMLNGDEIRPDEWYVVNLPEHLHNARVVDARDEDGEQVSEKRWLLLQVERQSLVVAGATR